MARTLDQLAIIANQIKDATLQGENTADRVGGLLVDLIDFLRTINVDEIALSPLLTALNESGLVDPQDGQILKFKSSEDNWVFSSDITQITSTIRTILDTLGQLDNRFVKKTGDIMTGLLTTLAGIKVRNFLQLGDRFVSGLLGEGAIFRENVGGRTYLEADEMYIRVKAYFDTVEIRKFLHSGGNRIASLGGAKCVRVEMLNSNNEVVTEAPAKYRCYFRASDGDDTITNDFVVGDQAYCHVTNATNSSLSMRHYWRLVVGKNELPNENGEHWIDLSNQESETIDGIVYSGYLNISDAPAAQDDIIQLGNVNDSTRRGAIIEFVSGNDAPAYQIFQDLGSIGSATTIAQKHDAQYSYNGKNYISMGYSSSTGRAFMNVYGDFLFGDPEESTYVKYNAFTKQLDIKATVHFISPTTHQETTLDTFASAVTGGLESLQRQIDGEIDTWFYNGTPGPSVLPESEWVAIDTQTGTNNERLKHLGDLYYDNSTGYAYRYTNTGSEASPVFTWSQISDSAVIKALEDAAKAQDTADHKRRVFVTSAGVLPTPPYSEGDIWMNVTYPANATATDAANNIYYNDILRCKVPATYNQQGELVREGVETGETALITHWQLSSKYTDDSKFNYFFSNTYSPFVTNIQNQVDKKAETWRQSTDPSLAQGWVASNHVGDLWMDTDQNNGHNTYIYVDKGEGTNPRYKWEPQAVPDEVFDEIDGKAEIFVQKPTTYHERDMWIIESSDVTCPDADIPANCKRGDIVVASSDSNSYNKAHWLKKDRYTDDTVANDALTKVTNLINDPYVQDLIGGSINQAITDGDASAVQQAVQAAQTTYGYLTQALNQDTVIEGGLVLTSLIALRDENSNVWSGISGTYINRTTPNPEDPDEPYALGHGIAAWYGGENIDHEAFPALTNYAKSLFRFDGSGYLASGNITWDDSGNLIVQGQTIKASTYYLNGTDITATLNAILSMFTLEGAGTTASPYVIKANFDLYSVGGITALGQGSQGGGGGSTTLYGLNDVSKNAAGDGVLGAADGYVLTYNGTTNHWYAAAAAPSGASALSGLTDVAISSLADKDLLQWDYATGKWKNVVLSTVMSAYALASSIPTNVSQLNNDSGYITSAALSGYATTSQLANYLPLSGGTISGGINPNADSTINLGTATAKYHYIYAHRIIRLQSISKGDTYDSYILELPNKSGTIAVTSDIPSLSGYATESWVNTQLGSYLPLSGGVMTGNITFGYGDTTSGVFSTTQDQIVRYNGLLHINTRSNQFVIAKMGTNGLILDISDLYGAKTQKFQNKDGTIALISDIPINNNQLTNGAGYITSSGSCAYATSAGSANYATPHRITNINDLNGWEMFTGVNVTGGLGSSWMQGICVLPNDDHNGYRCILSFYPYSTAAELYIKTQSGGTWGDWRKLLTNANSSVSKSGETLTVTIDGTSYSLTNTDHTYNFSGAGFYSGNMNANTHDCNAMLYNGVWYYNSNGPSTSLGASTSDGALYSQAYNTNWVAQIAQDYRNGRLFVRGRNGGFDVFSDWKRIAQYDEIVPKSGGTFQNYLNIRKDMVNSDWDAIRVWYNGGWSEALNKLAFINFTDSSGSVGKIGVSFDGSYGYISLGWLYNGSYGGSGEIVRITRSGLISNGGVTALSDERHKTIVEDTRLQVNDIARMRAVRYLWNDGRKDNDMHVGSIAQDWQQILPEVVLRANNDEGTLSLQYGVAALISSITIARKVVDHDRLLREQAAKISELENKCSFLEREVERLKCA